MMYRNFANYPVRRNKGFSGGRWIVVSIFACIFLVITVLLYFLALPSWQVRLGGVQTTAIAHADGICANDDDNSSDTYSFTYSFTGPQGKQYQIAHDNFCTNVINDGDQVAVWYMPNNPTNLLTTPEAILLYIFSGIGGAVDLACLVVIFLLLIGGLRARRRQETFDYTGMGLR